MYRALSQIGFNSIMGDMRGISCKTLLPHFGLAARIGKISLDL